MHSREKCIERITNIIIGKESSDTGELFAFCECLNKNVLNCQISVISVKLKIDIFVTIGTVSWESFAYKIYLPTIVEKQPKRFLSKRNGTGREIANVSAEEELVLYNTDNKK